MKTSSPCPPQSSLSFHAPVVAWLRPLGLAVLLLAVSLAGTHAATLSWSGGGADANWNNSANWGYVSTPADGDTLIFSASQPNPTTTNNISNLILNQIRFVGAGGGYVLRGNAFTLTNHIEATNSAGANTIENNIAFSTKVQIVDVASSLTLSGALSGGVGMTKNGVGSLTLAGAFSNTYGGTTTVNAGSMFLAKNGSPPASAIPGSLVIGDGTAVVTVQSTFANQIADSANVTINNNGTWNANNTPDTIGPNLTLTGNATINVGSANVTLSAPSTITASGGSANINGTGGVQLGAGPCQVSVNYGSLKIYPSVQGSAAITKIGGDSLFLYGNNAYTGLTVLSQGWLWVSNPSALGTTNSGTVVSNGATLVLQGGITITNEALTLNGPGVAGWSTVDVEAFETNTWTGPITLNADSEFGNYGGGTLRLSGAISGSGGLIEDAGGTLILEGTNANTYAGTTYVQAGTLILNKIGAVGSVYAIPGSLTLYDNTTVRLWQSWQLYSPTRSLAYTTTLNPRSVLDLNSKDDWLAQISLRGGQITNTTGLLYLSGDVTVVSNSVVNSSISGNLQLNTYSGVVSHTITNTGHCFSPDLILRANIRSSSTNALITAGAGEVELAGTNNTYTGATIVTGGSLQVDYTNGLGNTAQPAVVYNGASLFLNNNVGVGTKPLVLNGNGYAYGALAGFGSNSWAGDVTLAAGAKLNSYAAGNTLTLSGAISGPGALTTSGSGTVILSGATPNTYAGITTVSNGSTLVLQKTLIDATVPGNVDVFGTLRLGNSSQISDSSDVMLEPGSVFDFATSYEQLDTLRGTGSVTFGVGAFLAIGMGNGSSTYNGVMSGTGYAPGYTVGKLGTGTFTMNGNNAFTAGITRVYAGKLVINGSQPQIPVSVTSGTTLGGSGTVGTVAGNGIVAPGTGPGILTCSNLTFSASGVFNPELTGPNPGPGGYDQLKVRGTISLANATLNMNLAFTSPVAVGQKFTIIDNDGADPITGIFASHAEGATYSQNGYTMQISYVGGTGNDVVLTLTAVPGAIADSAVTSGNGSGSIDPNECNYLNLVLTNLSGTPMTGVSATLASITPEVAVTQPYSPYDNAPGNGRCTNTTPFQISTTTSFVCGNPINLVLTVTSTTHGSFIVPVELTSGSPSPTPLVYPVSVPTNIPDTGTIESTNTVAGFTGPLEKVVVSLWLTHPIDSDLTLSLVSPSGTTVTLVAATGSGANFGAGCSPDSNRTTFDDAAPTAITAGTPPFVGTFRPQGSLASFIGTTANGNWRLRITDSYSGTTGALRCWSLALYPVACSGGSGLCELCPNVVITSATGPGTPTQPNLCNYTGVPSTCAAPKTCPGTVASGPWPYNNHTFRNGPSSACITVTVENDATNAVFMLATVYSGSYNPANPDKCVNYLADGGNSISYGGGSQTFSFTVASNATFVVNLIANSASLCPYKLAVSGGDCRPVLNMAPIGGNSYQLDWTTAAPGYTLEQTNTVASNSGFWSPVPGTPAVVNGRFVTTNSAAGAYQFYRLHKP